MTWIDLILTPIYLLILYVVAYQFKPFATDKRTAKYFIPGFTVKIIGAIALGLVYQFYYGGGDTFVFYQDSSLINQVLLKNFTTGLKLLYSNDRFDPEIYLYTSRMHHFGDTSTYFVIKLAAVLSLISFNSYTVIACLFASISYSGLWNLYRTFYRLYPHLYKPLAYSVLFIPSVFFWGSGYLKDTITLASVGWVIYGLYWVVIKKQKFLQSSFVLIASCYILYVIKIYILLCLLPAIIVWVFLQYTSNIRSAIFKFVLTPLLLVVAAALSFYAIQVVGEDNSRYSLEAVAGTAEDTARWLAYLGETQGGSVYTLGDFDYSTAGMVRKALPAINVTLFRPYVWEVHNIVMMLSALESLFLLILTLYVLYKKGPLNVMKTIQKNTFVLFCLIFSVSFSFAIGISTYNFGSLVRYKIPMLPFYLLALLVILKPCGRRVLIKKRRKIIKRVEKEYAASKFENKSTVLLRS
jgi:hypothetical protein